MISNQSALATAAPCQALDVRGEEMKRSSIISLCVCLFACGAVHAEDKVPTPAAQKTSLFGVEYPGGNEGFFPPDAFSTGTNGQSSVSDWYSKHLRAMGEPSVFRAARTESNAVYRFTWLRSFHEPVAVRLMVLRDGSGELHAVMLDGKGGYEPGKVKKAVDIHVKAKDVRAFQQKFDLMEFWTRSIDDSKKGCWYRAPVRESWMRVPEMGCDGAQWIMEAAVSNQYNIVERWTPESGALREAALELIRLSGLRVGEVY